MTVATWQPLRVISLSEIVNKYCLNADECKYLQELLLDRERKIARCNPDGSFSPCEPAYYFSDIQDALMIVQEGRNNQHFAIPSSVVD